MTLSVTPARGATATKTTPTTIPTLRSSNHKLYKAGEFCPAPDLGKRSHSSSGIIKCETVKGHDGWESV